MTDFAPSPTTPRPASPKPVDPPTPAPMDPDPPPEGLVRHLDEERLGLSVFHSSR